MRDFCGTKAASAAAGHEERLFCMECEQRRATSPFESQQRTEYRYRERSRAIESERGSYRRGTRKIQAKLPSEKKSMRQGSSGSHKHGA